MPFSELMKILFAQLSTLWSTYLLPRSYTLIIEHHGWVCDVSLSKNVMLIEFPDTEAAIMKCKLLNFVKNVHQLRMLNL